MNVHVYIVNGVPQSGKTTFEEYCKHCINPKTLSRCDIISSVDLVKQIAWRCGWDGVKTPENRKFLSDLKQLLVDWGDVPYREVFHTIMSKAMKQRGNAPYTVFVDVREPEEIEKFKTRFLRYFDVVKTVFVNRTNPNQKIINSSDANVHDYNYDIYINNDGTLDELYEIADAFMESEELK